MRNQPSDLELLRSAFKVLKENLLPEITRKNRYNGLMVARSIEIAIRQMDSESTPGFSELELLVELLGQDKDLINLNVLLSKKIRNNKFNANSKVARLILDTLLKISHQKVSESNPKYFQSLNNSKT